MAAIVKIDPNGFYSNDFKNLLTNQDLIEKIELVQDYSTNDLYNDLCIILKNVKYLNEKSFLGKVG
jgi:hypothetical protein